MADREARLDALREEAARLPVPIASAASGCCGRPLLKPAVWTWEVPTYFFVGGAAGAAALVGAVAGFGGDHAEIARHARWVAAAGALLSAPLLIADLGRPSRFLNMLRVF